MAGSFILRQCFGRKKGSGNGIGYAVVLDMSHQSTLSLDASGVKPIIEKNGNRYDAIYEGDLGDGMTKMAIDFYFYEGRWLKHNPNE